MGDDEFKVGSGPDWVGMTVFLVFGILLMLAVLYGLVRFVKWAWTG
jgi:hypothetical protein